MNDLSGEVSATQDHREIVKILSSGQNSGKKFLDSKHVHKVYFKSSRKNLDSFWGCVAENSPLNTFVHFYIYISTF